MKNTKVEVTFLCCLWNEINRAPIQLNNLIKVLNKKKFFYEIIIIDNNSSDGTREWLRKIKFENVIKVYNIKNIGKGGSIRKGIEIAKSNIIVIFDLDGEYLPENSLVGIKKIEKTNAAVVLASRTLDGSRNFIYIQNYMGVKLITWVINKLFKVNLTDSATGLKIINTNFFKTHKLKYSGFNVDFEIVALALKHGMKVEEYVGYYLPRSKEDGKKIKAVRDGIASIYAILSVYLSTNR